MGKLEVVQSACLICDKGIGFSTFIQATGNFSIEGNRVATINDRTIVPFMVCKMDQKPCTPAVPAPWTNPVSGTLTGGVPILSEESKLNCVAKCGTIAVLDPGQSTIFANECQPADPTTGMNAEQLEDYYEELANRPQLKPGTPDPKGFTPFGDFVISHAPVLGNIKSAVEAVVAISEGRFSDTAEEGIGIAGGEIGKAFVKVGKKGVQYVGEQVAGDGAKEAGSQVINPDEAE